MVSWMRRDWAAVLDEWIWLAGGALAVCMQHRKVEDTNLN